MQLDIPLSKPAGKPADGHVDNPQDLLLGQRREDHNIVDTVDKLRTEVMLHLLFHLLLYLVCDGSVLAHLLDQQRASDVGCHNDDSIFEIHRAPLIVGQPAVVQKLQQDVEHIRMGFLNFIEEDDAVGPAAHSLCQLAAFVVAHISRRRSQKPRHGVLFHVFGHVDADHVALRIEQRLGQRLGKLCLSYAGGP